MEKGKITGSIYYRWVAIFCLAVVGFISFGILYYHYEANLIRNDKYEEISTIAKLKANSIQEWQRYRLADVQRASIGRLVKRDMALLLQDPTNSGARASLQIQLNINKKDTVYAETLFLDTKGHILLSDNLNPAPVDQTTMKAIAVALKDRKRVLSDFFRDPKGIIYIDAIAPILDNSGRPIAITVLRSKAADFLYPLIQSWPTPSKTGETLLVCREGDFVLFLNELRHRPNTALALRLPLTDTHLPGVQAALGNYGRIFGRDYRGTDVLAVTQPVPDSPWSIVAKVDADEVLAEVKYRAWAASIIVFLLILIAAGLIIGLYRNRQEGERRKAEEKLRESERRLSEAQKMAQLGHWVWDIRTGNVEWSEEIFNIFRLDPKEFTPHIDSIQALSPWPEDHERDKELIRRAMESHEKGAYEQRFLRPDNSIGYYHSTFQGKYDGGDNLISIFGTVQDITERKRAEAALQSSEQRLSDIVEFLPDATLVIDKEGKIIAWNKAIEDMTGIKAADMLGKGDYEYALPFYGERRPILIDLALHPHPEREVAYTNIQKMGNILFGEAYTSALPGKTHLSATASVLRNSDGEIVAAIECIRDNTKQRQAQEELHQAEERYRSIFENVQEGIVRTTPNGKIIMANPAAAKMFGYESPEEGMASVTDLALQHYVNPEDRRKLKEMIEEHGYIKGYEAQNCRRDGSVIWTSLTMQAVRDEKGQIIYFDNIIEDITNQKEITDRMRKALGATVQAMAVTVETRDPYTAGHQRRVADLARSIATEMDLPADQIDGIRMAAAIHDLGKISVPAEILSKPTKLTNIEFSLIKTHARSGYDILKDIDFPWPIARIVLEHHERMNGSGYPNGLSGDNILMESRVLSVADVVESMASHRPYRPGLGLDLALEEIEKNSGTLYDTGAADACLKLFREKGYQLENA